MLRSLVASLLLTGLAGLLSADPYYVVPPDTPDHEAGNFLAWDSAATNIQDAITAAATTPGATVWVSNGFYRLKQEITVGNVKLRSWPDGRSSRDITIVDGSFPLTTNRCFLLNHADALLEGFTITNGYAVIDSKNEKRDGGGGVKVTAGLLRNCLVIGNQTTNIPPANNYCGGGGGVCLEGVDAKMTDCIIQGNTTYHEGGGGVKIHQGGAMWNCTVVSNASLMPRRAVPSGPYYGGGGVSITKGWAYECSIIGNTTKSHGGGVMFSRPTAGDSGLRNCLVAGNETVGGSGGGVSLLIPNCVVLDNCTMAGNTDAGVYAYQGTASGDRADLTNCIVHANTDTYNIHNASPSGITINCDHVCTTNTSGVTFTGDGNILNKDPLFVDADAGNFRLAPKSPCIDAGIELPWMTAGAIDLDGRPRIDRIAKKVDLGAYENHPYGSAILVR